MIFKTVGLSQISCIPYEFEEENVFVGGSMMAMQRQNGWFELRALCTYTARKFCPLLAFHRNVAMVEWHDSLSLRSTGTFCH